MLKEYCNYLQCEWHTEFANDKQWESTTISNCCLIGRNSSTCPLQHQYLAFPLASGLCSPKAIFLQGCRADASAIHVLRFSCAQQLWESICRAINFFFLREQDVFVTFFLSVPVPRLPVEVSFPDTADAEQQTQAAFICPYSTVSSPLSHPVFPLVFACFENL